MAHTLPATNIAPENRPSQKETSLPTIHFRVLCYFQGGYQDHKDQPFDVILQADGR